jgi:hypothetical protein
MRRSGTCERRRYSAVAGVRPSFTSRPVFLRPDLPMLSLRPVRTASVLRLLVLAGFAALVAAPGWAGNVTAQPSGTGSPWTWTWPSSPRTSGYVLSTDGTGVTSWVSNSGTASTALSGIRAGTATNTINSTNKARPVVTIAGQVEPAFCKLGSHLVPPDRAAGFGNGDRYLD